MPSLREQPDHRDTDESRKYDTPVMEGKPIPSLEGAQVRERLPSGTDRTAILPHTRKRLGIKDDEHVMYVTDTANSAWQHHVAMDQISDTIDANYGEARIVTHQDGPRKGQPVKFHDHVLMAVPISVLEERRRNEPQPETVDEFMRKVKEEMLDGDNRKRSIQEREAEARANSEAMHASGMIGTHSPTHSKSLREAFSMYSEEEIRQESKRYREGNRTYRSFDPEDAKETKGKKTYGGLGGLLSTK